MYYNNKIIKLRDGKRLELKYDNWDDYGFKTYFIAEFIDEFKKKQKLGNLGIGMKSLDTKQVKTTYVYLNDTSERLSSEFFSLGTEEFYKNLNKLNKKDKMAILKKLNDVVADKKKLDEVKDEECLKISLMRSITYNEIYGRFTRIIDEDKELNEYSFNIDYEGDTLEFKVKPYSRIPSNIHAIIGSNGSGKTSLLKQILENYNDNSEFDSENSSINNNYNNEFDRENSPVNLVYCSFSIFDTINNKKYMNNEKINIISVSDNSKKINEEVCDIYLKAFKNCQKSNKKKLLDKMYQILSENPSIKELNLENYNDPKDAIENFKKFSSGHKIIVLTITKLVEIMEEKTLLIFDEPELHLHPTLLSSLVTALSSLLKDRNGMAILATHSPIILQELSNRCIYKISTIDGIKQYRRVDKNTLGESIDILTRDVFSYEIDKTGFFKKLNDDVIKYETIEKLIEKYEGKLGSEAVAIASALYYLKEGSTNEKNS